MVGDESCLFDLDFCVFCLAELDDYLWLIVGIRGIFMVILVIVIAFILIDRTLCILFGVGIVV